MSGNGTCDPPAEPALRVDTREELVYLLGQACEIEHGVMGEYLYAQFSLKRGPDEGLTDGQLARVQAWEKTQIALVPFGERALRHFIYLERPEGMTLDDAAGFAAAWHAQPLTAALSQRAGLGALAPLTEKLQSMSQDIAAHASKTSSRRRQHAVPDRREPLPGEGETP